MAKEIKLTAFIYPGCIVIANTSAKCVNGNYPRVARIFHDRHIEWERKRITDQIRRFVEDMAKEPFIAISEAQQVNFFNT